MHVTDPRAAAIPDIHGHAKGEHKPYVEERPIPYSARMLFLWFYHAASRGRPRFLMVADHINYLTFEDPAAVNLVRRALKLAAAGDLYGAAETAGVDLAHAAVVSEGLRRGMRYSIGAEVDNDPRARPDAQNIVDAMKPDGLIRSVHFLPIDHPVHGANWPWPFDNPEFSSLYETVGTERVWEIYMATLLEAIEKLPGHVVGHFYVPVKFGHWPDDAKLQEYEDRLIQACLQRGMAIELNLRFYYRYLEDDEQKQRYLDANLRLLKKAKEHGVGVAVGSDAHSPKDQGDGFERVLELLDAAEINELVFPIGGRLARVALRTVREEPEPTPAPEAGEPPATEAPAQNTVRAVGRADRPSRARPKRTTKPPTRDGSSAHASAPSDEPPERPSPPAADAQAEGPATPPAIEPPPVRKPAPRRLKAAPTEVPVQPETKPAAAPKVAANPKPAPKPKAEPKTTQPALKSKAEPRAHEASQKPKADPKAKQPAPKPKPPAKAKAAPPARKPAAKNAATHTSKQATKPQRTAAKKVQPASKTSKKAAPARTASKAKPKPKAAPKPAAKRAPAKAAPKLPARKPGAKKAVAKKRPPKRR